MATDLSSLRVQDGFRLRGESVSRVETFVDAAFAFGVTLLVISVGSLPASVPDLMLALHRIPTFVLCFLILVIFWLGHNRWSRRYGLETGATDALSLAFVLVMLIWIYPLRMVIGSAAYFMTGHWVPMEMELGTRDDQQDCFLVYSVGFAALSAILLQLHRVVLRHAAELELNELEVLETHRDLGSQVILLGSALLSILLTFVVRSADNFLASLPGFVYMGIGPAMHFHHARFHRKKRELAARRAPGPV